jgi:hypothetical protein
MQNAGQEDMNQKVIIHRLAIAQKKLRYLDRLYRRKCGSDF